MVAVGHDVHPVKMNIMCCSIIMSSFYMCNSEEGFMSEGIYFHVGHLALVTQSPLTSNGHVTRICYGMYKGINDSVIGIPKERILII